jgi:hypothetical protein
VGGTAAKAEIRIESKTIKDFIVDVPGDKPSTFEAKTQVKMGEARVVIAFTNPFVLDVDGNGRFDAPGVETK